MGKQQQKLAVIAVLLSVVAGCGGGGSDTASAPAPAPAPAAATPPAAIATLASPTDNRFAWNIETGIAVTLKDPLGAAVSPITCQSTDPSMIAVRSDCTKATLGRLGNQNITVSGGGHSATVALKGVPQRYWSGQHGAASSEGGDYSLIALADGTSLAWGANEYARLGQNKDVPATSYTTIPLPVLNAAGAGSLSQLYQVSAGTNHGFALSEEGNVWGWGRNFECKLAQSVCGNPLLLPVRVRNAANNGSLGNVVQVEAGDGNQVALLDTGAVMSWGNWHGQGDIVNKNFPGFVKTPDGTGALGDIVAISAGSSFSLALSRAGTVYAWGFDLSNGSLGAGAALPNPSPLPNSVKKQDGTALSNIVSISAGYNFALALDANGSVWAWGANNEGQIGQGARSTVVPYAVQVKNVLAGAGTLPSIVMVAAGGRHALALDNTGKVVAWGLATSGQLGDGANRPAGNEWTLPRPVVGADGATALSGVVSVAASYYSSAALQADGKLLMWGDNFRGALGRGDALDTNGLWISSPVPAPVVANAAKSPLILGSLAAYPNLLRRAR